MLAASPSHMSGAITCWGEIMTEMKLPAWRTTSNGNRYLGFWGLKVIVFQLRNERLNFNVLGLPDGIVWGPTFSDESTCLLYAADAFLEYRHARPWAAEGRARFIADVESGEHDRRVGAKYDADAAVDFE
jgi:hypothetical protein